jgi:hypothetical protein
MKWILKQGFKIGSGVGGGLILGPLGGAAGYTLAELILDDNDYDSIEEVIGKYLLKFGVLSVGGAAGPYLGSVASEALGSSLGDVIGAVSEIIPGDMSEAIASLLMQNEAVANLSNELCNLVANSCFSTEQKVTLISSYLDKFTEAIFILLNDEILDEMLGRETAKQVAQRLAQFLLNKLEEAIVYAL